VRIAYCTTTRLPTENAKGFQIAKVTQAFRSLGHEVEIFAPYRRNKIDQSFAAYYGLKSSVPLHQMGAVNGMAGIAPGFYGKKMAAFLFSRVLNMVLKKRKKEFDVIYTRSPELLPKIAESGIPVILELHRLPGFGKRLFLKSIRACRLISTLTTQMRQGLIDMGVKDIPVIVEGNGVDLHDFEALPDPADTKLSLSIPKEASLIIYAGQLESKGRAQGIPELTAAFEILLKRGLEFRAVIAGGPEDVRQRFLGEMRESLVPKVTMLGQLSHLKVPTLLIAGDVLVYTAPKTARTYFIRDTSPLKIFEYMAACRPIVCADLPPLHDALDESMAYFFEPGNSESLADAIRNVLDDPETAKKKALLARAHVEQFTWEKRMERILGAAFKS